MPWNQSGEWLQVVATLFGGRRREGLVDRSRARKRPATSVSGEVRERILQLRHQYPRRGPRKIRWMLEQAGEKPPAASTIGEMLWRAGLNRPQRRRRRSPPYDSPLRQAVEANDVWSVDFKGWFATQDGRRCDPLTILDQYSRYLVDCRPGRVAWRFRRPFRGPSIVTVFLG